MLLLSSISLRISHLPLRSHHWIRVFFFAAAASLASSRLYSITVSSSWRTVPLTMSVFSFSSMSYLTCNTIVQEVLRTCLIVAFFLDLTMCDHVQSALHSFLLACSSSASLTVSSSLSTPITERDLHYSMSKMFFICLLTVSSCFRHFLLVLFSAFFCFIGVSLL